MFFFRSEFFNKKYISQHHLHHISNNGKMQPSFIGFLPKIEADEVKVVIPRKM